MTLYKYQGAGNDFLIADNRDGALTCSGGTLHWRDSLGNEKSLRISEVCDRRYGIGADGLMLLEHSETYDFKMVYFNSDGSGGMMCGNGGRCIVAFAADRGLAKFSFEAADGPHEGYILRSEGNVKTVRLKMKDVSKCSRHDCLSGVAVPSDGWFLDTGTRHFVRFVSDVEDYPVYEHGRAIRYGASQLQPVGANVNFVEPAGDVLKVRTYEKGVEDETFACGTGIVASCIAAYVSGIKPSRLSENGAAVYDVKARRDSLSVDFLPSADGTSFTGVHLTGPASYIAEVSHVFGEAGM